MQMQVYRVDHRFLNNVSMFIWHAPGSKTVNTRIKWADGSFSSVMSFKLKTGYLSNGKLSSNHRWAKCVVKISG